MATFLARYEGNWASIGSKSNYQEHGLHTSQRRLRSRATLLLLCVVCSRYYYSEIFRLSHHGRSVARCTEAREFQKKWATFFSEIYLFSLQNHIKHHNKIWPHILFHLLQRKYGLNNKSLHLLKREFKALSTSAKPETLNVKKRPFFDLIVLLP